MVNNPCDTKVLYDTEFEAEIAASKATADFESEMYHYPCGSHWHIANKNKQNRSKNRKFNKTYCGFCDCYLKRGNWDKHSATLGHQRKVRIKENELHEL